MAESGSSQSDPNPRTRDETAATDPTRSASDDYATFADVTGDFYRGEVDRLTTWRSRLDQTTNWAVVVMVAILTWVFSSDGNPHYVLLIGMAAVGVFLFIEAQRYQEYDAWRSRVRTVQEDFIAGVLDPGASEREDWRDRLSRDLREPNIDLPLVASLAHRLQRTYMPLLGILLVSWIARITVFEDAHWREAAAIGTIPGVAVVGALGVVFAVLVALTMWSVHQATKREFDETSSGPVE